MDVKKDYRMKINVTNGGLLAPLPSLLNELEQSCEYDGIDHDILKIMRPQRSQK